MPDRFHPVAIAQAYREEFPGKFNDLSDTSLLEAIKELDPETYKLIDPALIGAEALSRGYGPAQFPPGRPPETTPKPLPVNISAPPNLLEKTLTVGGRIVPAVAGGIIGGMVGGPVGAAVGGAIGAGSGEAGTEVLEQKLGRREEISPGTIMFESALGSVAPVARGATIGRRVMGQAGYGAVLGGGGTTGRALIERGEFPTPPEIALGTVIGAGAGAALQGAAEGIRTVYAGRRPSVSPDLPTVTAAKDYLAEAAAAKVSLDEIARTRALLEQSLSAPPPPPPSLRPAQKLLPAQAGPGGAPPGSIRVYPSGYSPSIELVGSRAPSPSRIIGATDVGAVQPPPTLEEALVSSLEHPPGPPQLVRPLELSSLPAEAGVPRGMVEPPLLRRPLEPFSAPIRQKGQYGGAEVTRESPQLPHVLEAGVDRPYTRGPNAGPRRPPRQELHGEPRPLRRQLETGGKVSYEDYLSRRPAEDPGTYPPEVRRELATMVWELESFPYERHRGGVTSEQIDAMVRSGVAHDASDAIRQLRQSGVTGGGATAGAPVYHDIRAAAEGSFAHATRATQLRQIRSALLEGKGTGLTDAAAAVARARLEERARGSIRKGSRILAKRGDEGDYLIGWIDDQGRQALPSQDLSEVEQLAREASDGEILGAVRTIREVGRENLPNPEFFDQALEEAARRGLIDPTQGELRMEGPGGAGGPKLTEFEGGPPDQPSLPGAESVREQAIPTPEVADLPFSLTPPPSKPAIAPRTGSLFTDLLREEGVLVFDIPAGDRKGLKKWLASQEKEHGGEPWFNRTEQAIEEGNWDRAFKTAAAASARSYAQAYSAASTPAQQARLSAAVRGTPLQSDLSTEIVSGARQRAGVGTAPRVPDFPPSIRVTQAGAARGKGTLGPAGILNPGARQRPLSSAAPELRAATLDTAVVRLIQEGIETPEGLSTIPGNTDTYLRLFRQVGEQIYRGKNLQLLKDAGVRIPPEELAQHWNATISDAGRTLNLLSQFAQRHREALTEAAAMQDFGAMRGRPTIYTGARGRVSSPAGQQATQEVIDQIAADTSRYQASAMANDLQKRSEVGPLRAIHDASYAWMLSKWATAVRNYVSFAGRYSVESLDHALTLPLSRLLGDESSAALSRELLRERGVTPFRRGTSVTPKGGWQADLQGIYDFTTDSLNTLSPEDARRSIRLLLDLPDEAAHFLGTAAGEDLSSGYTHVPVLRHLTNPRVQRFLTMFNRAQEFSARATVFDGTTRALLRARGLDPTTLLQRSTPEVIEAVGGPQAFQDLLSTATAQSLEATFAGRTSKDSLPGALIRFINDAWPAKLGIPFPRFNLSAAPRFIWDHGPWALVDLVRFPLDRAGLTAPRGTVAGGRLYRGVRSQEITEVELPALQLRIGQAERQQGEALGELLATQREFQVRGRQIARLEKQAQQGTLTDLNLLEEARSLQSQLSRRRETLKSTIAEQSGVVKDLTAEQKKLLARVADATGINAPNYAQYLARVGVGTVGMLGAAMVVRAQEGAQGTRWYEYRVDRGEGKDPIILDFRPFAPFAQYLFVADVLNDFYQQTNWEAAKAQAGEEGYGPGGALAWSRAIWENYEGKYTEKELGSQFAQAFLSISRAAGTTLTLTDLMTQNGWPSLEDAARATVGTIGQFLSRFTVPGQQISDVLISPFSEEEAKVRTPPKATWEDWERPLAGPLANVPLARQIIPERISQTTGQPVAAEYPLLRGLLGIGTTPRDFIVEEVRRIGIPGSSVYLRETGDYGLDRLVAETYARNLKTFLPEVFEAPEYGELGTPARQRDYLQRYIFPAIKRASLAEVRESLGTARFEEATVKGEDARRKVRQQRLVEQLEGETPSVETVEEEPAEPTPPAPGLTPPPPPPPPF